MKTDRFRSRLAPAAPGLSLARGLAGCACIANITSSVTRLHEIAFVERSPARAGER